MKHELGRLDNTWYSNRANQPLQSDLFVEPSPPHPAVEMISKLDPDCINARQALDLLYKLKEMTEKS